MAASPEMNVRIPILHTLELIRLKKGEIYSIYFFATMYGLLQLTIPLGIQMVVNFIQAFTYSTSLWVLIVLVLLGVLFSGIFQVTQMRLIERINQKVFSRYGIEFAYRIPKMDMKSVDHYYLPELINRFFDTVSIQKSLGKLLIDIPTASIQIIFGIILLSFYSQVFIIFGILLLVILFLIIWGTTKRGISTSYEESNYKYQLVGWLEEMARAFRIFKFSIDANLHIKQSDNLVSGYLTARTSHFKVLLTQYWSLIAFKLVITATMLIVGAVLAINNQINVGQFVAAEIVILMIMASVEKFIYSLDTIYDLLISITKLRKVIEMPLEANGTIKFDASNKGVDVKVKELSFSFEEAPKVLQNVTFHVPSGTKACIMGQEGAGKSVLLRMMTGAYSDYTGSVLINEVPVHNYDLRTLHQNTGIILNDQDIFHGTVLDNITLGNPDISLGDVTSLAAITQFDQYLPKLPEGYDTVLDVAGSRLSKATVQKILLMRALIHKPRLLILENPTSGLNKDSRESIESYILNDMRDTTVIVSTNDVEFANKCHQVIVMQQGRVAAKGKVDEVLPYLNY
jgi:ABC-type bacteriocin/lantibiotic exporter with double-glycine peptidase domain